MDNVRGVTAACVNSLIKPEGSDFDTFKSGKILRSSGLDCFVLTKAEARMKAQQAGRI